MEKQCFKCDSVKPLSEFYKHREMADGHLGKCKECTKADVKANREAKREQYSEYERARFQRPERKAQMAESLRRQRQHSPEKYRARTMVGIAVKAGRLKRLPCEDCGNPRSQGHHDDYSKPLDVRWLCFVCHRKEHGQVVVQG